MQPLTERVDTTVRIANLSRRDQICQEIVQSEHRYVSTLKLIVSAYIVRFKDAGVPFPQTIDGLMQQIPILYNLHNSFFKGMTKRIANFDEATTEISPVFLEFIPHFKMYSQYVNMHNENVTMMEGLDDHALIKKFAPNAYAITGQRIGSLLVNPIQRLPRYEMLLSELIKHTPSEHPDYKGLVKAKNLVIKINKKVNSGVNESNSRRETSRIIFRDLKKKELHKPSRIFLFQFDCTIVKDKKDQGRFTCYLFSDLFYYNRSGLFSTKQGQIAFQKDELQGYAGSEANVLNVVFPKEDITLKFDDQKVLKEFKQKICSMKQTKQFSSVIRVSQPSP